MSHLKDQLAAMGLTKTRSRKPQPFDRFTKAQLWQRLQEMEARLERCARNANTLGRDIRKPEIPLKCTIKDSFSDRAYRIRDIARGKT